MNEVLLTIYNDNEVYNAETAKQRAKQIVREQIQEYSKKFHMSESKIKDLVLKMNPEGILDKKMRQLKLGMEQRCLLLIMNLLLIGIQMN